MLRGVELPERLLGILCRKWAGPIVVRLGARAMRFGELGRAVPGLSRRMLATELRRLVREGVVQRQEIPGRQPTTQYMLTPLGLSLRTVLRRLRRWERVHLRGGVLPPVTRKTLLDDASFPE